MKHSEQIHELAAALAAAQSQMTVVEKDGTNPAFKSKYPTLSSVHEAVRPLLSAQGIAYTQGLERSEKGYLMTTLLMHKSGQWLLHEFPIELPAFEMKSVGHAMQALGCMTTYSCRYGLTSAVGISSGDEDDDAEAAKKVPVQQKGAPDPRLEEFNSLIRSVNTLLDEHNISSHRLMDYVRMRKEKHEAPGINTLKEALENPENFLNFYREFL